ncbi:ABC transporter substrate-binding protein [Plasticicumulans acidivorans]|uniref:Amino acid/amide ABC transporter substrate-binding protein (HAAT family) n=1 Tax=Plasticicumulans acidivorans TaxID=886464 RepID=A0A317MVQ2_9GAMM|nr:ABC transporter substrate-binding protein [Plasticicumulans acidivorans]PWV61221.1 amino acid/amide ABC transporter substrate-binding protein (HAAT family) [Plasticicumulans acidivorans]
MKRISLTLSVLLGLGLTAATQAAEPIRIGSVLSVSGPAAFLGDPELKTLQLYVERLNAAGGLLGRPLELVHYDDAGEAAKANTFVKRLIASDKVDVILGGTTTGATMAAVPLVEKAQLPFISFAGAVVIVDPVKPWVFKTPHTDRMACEKVFADMHKRGLLRVALLSETSGFGKSGHDQCVDVAPAQGVSIVVDETYGAKDTDMSAQLTKVRGSDAQAVLVFGLGQSPAIVTKNYRQLGIELPLYQSHGVASKEFLALAGAAAEGVRLPSPALLVADKLADSDPQKAVVTGYTAAYTQKFGGEVSTFGGYAYDGLMLWADAVKRAGSVEADKVRAALEATRGYVGASGVVNMSPSDHMGLDASAFRMLEVRDGGWTLVD